MIIRLKVNGFKNLVDVDVRFGPFTCIAGVNGAGKSNLFDAIRFLSALASKPLVEAALSIRAEGGRASDLRSLFHRVGNHYAERMSFDVEMIVPAKAVDDLGQTGEASITILRYSLELGYRKESQNRSSVGTLEILREALVHIKKGEAAKHLLFPHSRKKWRDMVITGARRSPYFISTEGQGEARVIKLHQDRNKGRPLARAAAILPRTVLSVANAAESPTVLCARREMQSWRILQLEPSALRKPDEINASPHLALNGAHLAANLYHLAQAQVVKTNDEEPRIDPDFIFSKVANRLSTLIGDIRGVWVDRDDKREILTLQVTGKDGTHHPARALSDGTLRFLALSVLELDVTSQGVICLEEPENGIHPERIPAMLRLLRDIAADPAEPVDESNPLRQVIVNTHSPAVVSEVPDASLLVAESMEDIWDGRRFKKVTFSCLSGTWRTKAPEKPSLVSKGKLLAYLNPASPSESQKNRRTRRVVDRDDLQMLFPFGRRTDG